MQVTTRLPNKPGHRAPVKPPGLRVEPTDEKWRVLKHPSGARFRSSGSAEWPNDDFTRRRIRAGSIRLVEEKTAPVKPAAKAPPASEAAPRASEPAPPASEAGGC
jgi:hypothetical protein